MKIALTGHRTSKINKLVPLGLDYVDKRLYLALKELHPDFSTLELNLGGALGFDTCGYRVARKYHIQYHLYLPFPADVMTKLWKPEDKETLKLSIQEAETLTIIGSQYAAWYYLQRDEAMVDNAALVVSLFDTTSHKGGTKHTVDYALDHHKDVYNLTPPDLKLKQLGNTNLF